MANKLKIIIVLLLFGLKASAQCTTTYGTLVISEVYFDTHYQEAISSKYHSFGEYIEIYNSSDTTINLKNWTISDNHTSFQFVDNDGLNNSANLTIAPGGFKIITFSGFYAYGVAPNGAPLATGGRPKFIDLFPSAVGLEDDIILQNKLILYNDVEKITLKNPAGKIIDEISYKNGSTPWDTNGTPPLVYLGLSNYTYIITPKLDNYGNTVFNGPIYNDPETDPISGAIQYDANGFPISKYKKAIYRTAIANYYTQGGITFQTATASPFTLPFTVPQLPIDPFMSWPVNPKFNETESFSYDLKTGLVNGQSKSYFDELGKPTVSLNKDFITGNVWGTETVYDNFGRKSQESFPAINCFSFDKVDFISNPTIKSSMLDWYYSNSNTTEPYQATATQPYSEINYDKLNPGGIVNVIGGNQVTNASGNLEWKTGRSYTVPAAQEAYYFYGLNYYDGTVTLGKEEVITKFYKSVGVDANGNENVSFSDGEGKVLASARSGGTISYPVISTIGTQGFVDVHIPAGVTAPITLLGGASLYDVYDLTANTGVITTAPLVAGNAYRIVAKTYPTTDPLTYIDTTGGAITTSTGALGVSYSVNYYDYAVNIYNKTGQLMKTVQPNGFAQAFPTSITMSASPAYMPLTLTNFSSIYTYDNLGQVVASSSSDEGSSQFAYRQDGQIRYSQSALQLPPNKVSYTNYDSYARPIESGVITGTTGIWASAQSLVDSATMVAGTPSEQTVTIYDEVANNQSSIQIPANLTLASVLTAANSPPAYTQKNLSGNVAITFTRLTATTPITAITWYSYDIYGRAEWVVQYNDGIGAKTIDYEYDYQGNVKKVIFQKYKSAELFAHEYTYDANSVLTYAATSTSNLPGTFTTQAQYSYYKTGELKRTYLMQAQQGLDYVYTLGGALKSINHPSLTALNDPGHDSNDLFGITLDYYKDDYTRTGTNIVTSSNIAGTTQDFNGNIMASRWANRNTVMDWPTGNVTSNQKGYLYNYDRNNWLTGAAFGTTASTPTAAITPLTKYKEGNLQYDANGNIKTLQRTNNLGVTEDNLTYNYTNAGKNQLNSVDDTAVTAPALKDIKDQNPNNYGYDAIGQMTRNTQENLSYIYNTQGLVTEVRNFTNSNPLVKFFYNERGQRIKKESFSAGVLQSTSFYILDLSGNVMANYNLPFGGNITQTELPIYGTSRLGVYTKNGAPAMSYQLTDHLGNVRAVVTKQVGSSNPPTMTSYADYYPFGEQLPTRNSMSAYRYAFQGQELDPETGMEAFQLRLWDGRIGRWLTTDPYGQYASPYLGMGNNPIGMIDPDGGYTNWFAAFIGWAGSGFKGKIEHTGGEGNKNYSIFHEGGVIHNGFGNTLDEVVVDRRFYGKNNAAYNNFSKNVTNNFSLFWNSDFAREKIKDQYSFGISTNCGAIFGVNNTPINFTVLTRGEIGLYYTPSVGGSAGNGVEGSITFSGSEGNYTGDPRKIKSSMLQGHTVGVSAGVGAGIVGSAGISYAMVNHRKPITAGGFINVTDQVGLGLDVGTTGVSFQGNYNYTPVVKTIFDLHRLKTIFN